MGSRSPLEARWGGERTPPDTLCGGGGAVPILKRRTCVLGFSPLEPRRRPFVDHPRPADLGQAGALLIRALVELAEQREDVRTALRTVLDSVLDEGGAGRGDPKIPAAQLASSGEASTVGLVDKVLTPRSVPGREETSSRPARRADLAMVLRRARWKAAACRLAVDKRATDEGDVSVTRVEENLRRQRTELDECWAWMLDSPRGKVDDRRLLEVAACYDTVALAAESVAKLEGVGALTPKPPAELLYLMAEAQSALLAGLHACDLRGDSDQRDLFLWLKEQTTRHRIYVDRHMRLDDPADSSASPDLSARIHAFVDSRLGLLERGRVRNQLLNKVRYHLGKARDAGAATEADLNALEAAAADWIDAGLDPGDTELGDMVAELAVDSSSNREATAKILALRVTDIEAEVEEPQGSRRDIVGESRALLDGLRALAIGPSGEEEQAQALVPALGLGGLRYLVLGEDEPPMPVLEIQVAAPETDLVLIAHRLPQDAYDRFKALCMERERPFVRLPASGFEPEEVGHQILRQVAWRLRQESSSRTA